MGRTLGFRQKFGVAVVVALALGLVASSIAIAFTWKVAGVKWPANEAELIEVGLSPESKAALQGKIAGAVLKLTSEELVAAAGTSIFQGPANASSEGILEFKKLTSNEPVGCLVAEPIKTTLLKGEMVAVGGVLYEKFEPKVAANLGTVKIEKCAMAGVYLLKGTLYGLVEPLKTELVDQPITFSPGILGAAGGSLTLGGKFAEFDAEMVTKLKEEEAGKKFGVE